MEMENQIEYDQNAAINAKYRRKYKKMKKMIKNFVFVST